MPGKLVIAGIGLCALAFIVVEIAMIFNAESSVAQSTTGAAYPPAVVALNLTVFMTGAMGFCLVVSGLMVWFIQETGTVNRETKG